MNIIKIQSGEEKRTTVMIRNTPNKFKQMTLLEMINERHLGKYDYFYLPMDLKVRISPVNIFFLDLVQCWIRIHKLHSPNIYP